MDTNTLKYREAELIAVSPLPVSWYGAISGNGQFKVQITSEKGKTKYLNITPQEFKKIEEILLGIE